MFWFLKKVAAWLVGGSLDHILQTIEHGMDDETKKEEIKAEVTRTWITAQANLLVGRTWWFQLFFIIPLGFWWAAVMVDSVFQIPGWDVAKLPEPLDEWAAWIISALFIVDGSKAVIAKFRK